MCQVFKLDWSVINEIARYHISAVMHHEPVLFVNPEKHHFDGPLFIQTHIKGWLAHRKSRNLLAYFNICTFGSSNKQVCSQLFKYGFHFKFKSAVLIINYLLMSTQI